MSTIATTRPPHTNTLSTSVLSTPTAVGTPLSAQSKLLAHCRNVMHPDCLLLQSHGVTSPRLSPTVPAATGDKVEIVQPHSMEAEVCDLEISNASDSRTLGRDADNAIIEHMDVEEGDSVTQATAIKLDARLRCSNDTADDDAVSLCSEDSELSVGQEGSGGTVGDADIDADADAEPDVDGVCDLNQQRRLLLHNMGDMMALCAAPSAFSSVANSGDGSDARSSASTDEASTLHGGDEDGAGTPTSQTHINMEPFMMANALRMPVTVPVPVLGRAPNAPFQAEFMRKSHQYAEELVKQQMQFMAAARASAFTLRGVSALEGAADKRPFRPQPSLKMPEMPANLAGIHSQLTAISKMSQLSAVAAAAAAAAAVANKQQQQSTGGSAALAKLSALGMLPQAPTATPSAAPAASANLSVSSLSQLQAQMQAHLPFMQCNNNSNGSTEAGNNNNNNLNEPALKFSIDNILKADFGRRITEPLKRAGSHNNSGASNGTRTPKSGTALLRMRKTLNPAPVSGGNAIDLTSLMSAATSNSTSVAISSAPSLSFSHTLAHICTNSSDSSGTAASSNGGQLSARASCNISPAQASSSLTTATATTTTRDGSGELAKSTVDMAASSFSSQTGGNNSNSNGSSSGGGSSGGTGASGSGPIVWPAWVYCTRYSDRPSSGPRTRKPKKQPHEKGVNNSSGSAGPAATAAAANEDKRPRTAFSGSQLARLKHEFTENRYLTEKRRQQLSSELGLNEAQIKIWFQNKRAKLKKSSGTKNPLALQLMAQGLYNHSTIPLTREEEELQELQERENAAAAASAGSSTASSIST